MSQRAMQTASASAWPGNTRAITFGLLVLFIGTLPWDGGITFLGIDTISKVLGIVVLLVGITGVVSQGTLFFRLPSLFHLCALAFVAWGLTSFFWSINPSATFRSSITYVQLLGMVWLVWEFARSERQRATLMQAYVVGGHVAVLVALSAYLSSGQMRDVGNFNANGLAFYLALGVPLAWQLILTSRSRLLFWVNAAYLPMVFLAIIVAASRGGLLTALVGLLIVPLTYTRLSGFRKALLVLLFVATAWAIYSYLPTAFPDLQRNFDRLGETQEELQTGTLTYRRLIWESGLQLYRDNPVLGVGLGSFRFGVADHYGEPVASHNSFLSVLVDLGIVGAMLFGLTMAAALAGPLLTNSGGRTFALVLFMTLVVGMFPLEVEDRKPVWFMLSLLAGQQAITLTNRWSGWPREVPMRQALPLEGPHDPPPEGELG